MTPISFFLNYTTCVCVLIKKAGQNKVLVLIEALHILIRQTAIRHLDKKKTYGIFHVVINFFNITAGLL